MSACACIIAALAVISPQAGIEAGRYAHCCRHGQMLVFDGTTWRWSNQADDIGQLPRTAHSATSGCMAE